MSDYPTRYPLESLSDDEDNGTIVENVEALAELVVGHRIVSAERGSLRRGDLDKDASGYLWGDDDTEVFGFVITLDTGQRVLLEDTDDCCAHTSLEAFLLNPSLVDHIITGVGTTDGYTTWHVFADMGDVLELSVSWSAGNPFYYGYGFEFRVTPIRERAQITPVVFTPRSE